MSILQEVQSEGAREEIEDAVEVVIGAEESGEEWRNSGNDKNTHFELRFGEGTDEEVYVYFERLETDTGFEVMFWADESYFRDCEKDRPDLSDGGRELEEFADYLLNLVSDVVGVDHYDGPRYHIDAPPSVVFNAFFYL